MSKRIEKDENMYDDMKELDSTIKHLRDSIEMSGDAKPQARQIIAWLQELRAFRASAERAAAEDIWILTVTSNGADTCRDPDEIHTHLMKGFTSEAAAVKFANEYIKEHFWQGGTGLCAEAGGNYCALELCSYGMVLDLIRQVPQGKQ